MLFVLKDHFATRDSSLSWCCTWQLTDENIPESESTLLNIFKAGTGTFGHSCFGQHKSRWPIPPALLKSQQYVVTKFAVINIVHDFIVAVRVLYII